MDLALEAFNALGDRNLDALTSILKKFAGNTSARDHGNGFSQMRSTDVFPQIARWTDRDERPLIAYAAESFPQAIPILVQAGFDVNIAGTSPLYYLTDIVHLKAEDAVPVVEAVRTLLAAGADPNRNGCLHRVVENSPLEVPVAATMAALLLQYGADFNRTDEYEQNPLDVAFDWCNAPVVRVLTSAGAKLSAGDTEKDELTSAYLEMLKGNVEMIRYISDDVVNSDHGNGKTFLHVAATIGDLAATNILLERGAEIESRGRLPEDPDYVGNTPLYIACVLGYPSVAEALLDVGADTQSPSSRGNSLLAGAIWGAMENKRSAVEADNTIRLLVNHGLGIISGSEDSPFLYAHGSSGLRVIELLRDLQVIKKKEDWNAVLSAVDPSIHDEVLAFSRS